MIEFLLFQTPMTGLLMCTVVGLCCLYGTLVAHDTWLSDDTKYKICVVAGSFVMLQLAQFLIGSLPNFMLIGSGMMYLAVIIRCLRAHNISL